MFPNGIQFGFLSSSIQFGITELSLATRLLQHALYNSVIISSKQILEMKLIA